MSHAITPTATMPFGEALSAFRSQKIGKVEPHAISGDPEVAAGEDAIPLLGEELDLVALALQLADEVARSDIECFTQRVESGGQTWHDLDSADDRDEAALCDRAARYLALRGEAGGRYLVFRNLAFPHLIRFEDLE